MVHLAVHLPAEAMLRGPVQFEWMYPVERRLYTLKRSVRNKGRPEGSIAQAYVVEEALTFCPRREQLEDEAMPAGQPQALEAGLQAPLLPTGRAPDAATAGTREEARQWR
jgi:hypothetical protein